MSFYGPEASVGNSALEISQFSLIPTHNQNCELAQFATWFQRVPTLLDGDSYSYTSYWSTSLSG